MSRKKLNVVTVEETPLDEGDSDSLKKSVLSLKGVGPSTYEKLSSQGYDDLEVIAGANPKVLASKCELTESFARGIIREARNLVKMDEFQTALELYQIQEEIPRFISNISSFDGIFQNGGISYGSVLELFGKNATGKTQICMQMAIEEARRGNLVYIIDTHNSFSTIRLRQMCANKGYPFEEVLNRIIIRVCGNTSQQMLSLEKLHYHPNRKQVRLVILDTATRFFRSEYTGRGFLAERQQMLNIFLGEFSNFCRQNNALGVFTNHVIDSPGTFFGDPSVPAGGNTVAQNSNYRIYLRKSKADTIKGKIIAGSDIPEGEFYIRITHKGVESE